MTIGLGENNTIAVKPAEGKTLADGSYTLIFAIGSEEFKVSFTIVTAEVEAPETPDIPEAPETPDIPEVPETPETPEVPEETPETPAE